MTSLGYLATQRPATQEEVLLGFVALLKAEFAEWDDTAIYWTETAVPDTENNLTLFIQVHAGAGEYDQGIQGGAGTDVLQEDCYVGVTIWHRCELDPSGRGEQSLFKAGEGLLAVKRRVLKALSGKLLRDTNSIVIATRTIRVMSAMEPRMATSDGTLDSLGAYFSVAFDWDLS